MRRRIAFAFAAAAAFVAAAAVATWLVAAPRGISAEVASAVSEAGDPEAGRNVFFIAGCESCHMSPGQKDPFRLGGGTELKTPFGSFYPPNISPHRADGIGAWTAGECARFPILDPARRRILETPLYAFNRTPSRRRSDERGGARPLSCSGAGPLRGMPFSSRFFGRDHRRATADRRPAVGGQGQGAERHGRGTERLVQRRHRDRALDRLHPVGRRARRPDGFGSE